MRRLRTLLVVVLLVAAGAAVPAFGLGGDDGPVRPQSDSPTTADSGENATNATNDTEPGARLAGVVGVQGAEVGGELEQRRFQRQLETASTNDSKAAVVAAQTNRSSERLAELEAELDRLETAHENGTLSEGEYRARVAQVSARLRVVERLSDRTAEAADRLPNETLERNGVNVTAIRRLRTDASELSGPEVAATARAIAGPNVGHGFGPPGEADDEDDARGQGQSQSQRQGQDAPDAGERGQSNETASAGDDERGPPDDGPSERRAASGADNSSGDDTSSSAEGSDGADSATANAEGDGRDDTPAPADSSSGSSSAADGGDSADGERQ